MHSEDFKKYLESKITGVETGHRRLLNIIDPDDEVRIYKQRDLYCIKYYHMSQRSADPEKNYCVSATAFVDLSGDYPDVKIYDSRRARPCHFIPPSKWNWDTIDGGRYKAVNNELGVDVYLDDVRVAVNLRLTDAAKYNYMESILATLYMSCMAKLVMGDETP